MPLSPMGGVQLSDDVATISGALDILSPGSRRSAGSSGVPSSLPIRLLGKAGISVSEANCCGEVADRRQVRFDLHTLGDHAGLGPIAGTCASRRAVVTICSAQIVLTGVDVLHEEDGTVERVQLEVREFLTERGDADAELAGLILRTDFEGIYGFFLELQVRRIQRVHIERYRGRQRRAVEIEAASLVAARVRTVEQQVRSGLVAQDRRAGELIFVTSIGERYAVQFRSRIALTRQRDDTACQTSQTRDPKQGAQKGAVLRANDVVVAERGREPLARAEGADRIPAARPYRRQVIFTASSTLA